jgi:hypothetical protein
LKVLLVISRTAEDPSAIRDANKMTQARLRVYRFIDRRDRPRYG